MPKGKVSEALRLGGRFALWVYELELVTVAHDQGRVGLWADTEPVDSRRSRLGTVGLNPNLKTGPVECVNERLVELEQGLATGTHDVFVIPSGARNL